MRVVLGALSGLAGAVAGFLLAVLVAALFANVTNASTREGAVGYFVIAVGVFGAVAGTLVGILLFARSAPPGEGARAAGSAVLGLVAGSVSLWVSQQEGPAKYGDTQASLLLEFRLRKDDAPEGPPSRWLDEEVQTATTRPAGLVLSDEVREEGGFLVVPVVQNPVYRSSSRVIVARVADEHVELLTPPMRAKPKPGTEWSSWYPPRPVLELRYRVRLFGE